MTDIRQIFECTGCGVVTREPEKQMELYRAAGKISCCPERKMAALSRPIDPKAEVEVEVEVEPVGEIKNAILPWKAGKPFRNMPEHKGWVFPIHAGGSDRGYLVAHLYANAIGKGDAKAAQKLIVDAVNAYASPSIVAPVGVKPLELLEPADDEAFAWVMANASGLRRDDGSIEYGLAAVVRAYQAGKEASK